MVVIMNNRFLVSVLPYLVSISIGALVACGSSSTDGSPSAGAGGAGSAGSAAQGGASAGRGGQSNASGAAGQASAGAGGAGAGGASGGTAQGGTAGNGGSNNAGAPNNGGAAGSSGKPAGTVSGCAGNACPHGECSLISANDCDSVYKGPISAETPLCAAGGNGQYCLALSMPSSTWVVTCTNGSASASACDSSCSFQAAPPLAACF